MLVNDEKIEEQCEALVSIKSEFDDNFGVAQNESYHKEVRELCFSEAKGYILQAHNIALSLSDCEKRFPMGLPMLPLV